MNIIYTQENCPKCKILKKKMDDKHVEYVECSDVNVMVSKGVEFTPMLEVDGQMKGYSEAVKWVNEV